MAVGFPPARPIDQNPAHSLCCYSKEVRAILELLLADADQFQPHFMNERGGLKRLAWGFQPQFVSCQPPQFIINQIEKLVRGSRVALFRSEQYRGVTHDRT